MLEAPPADAIRNAKEGRGLGPSEYAGGGSASSSFPGEPGFLLRGRALVDSSAVLERSQWVFSKPDEPGKNGEYAGAVVGKPTRSERPACESKESPNKPQETEEDKGLRVDVPGWGYWGGED